ncbi:FadR/GntR family transcriptional regulator [Compostibacter hankyongensis]|uniref:GntR family transcriptional regulator n=1 Tax=Compostibacter hankyongensis TaxID=1007089 RepID=A0ABP8G213_9BACT
MKNDSTLTEQVEQKILKYITEQGYQIGDTLPRENEFALLLGVSRVVVREALSRLRIMGFVETRRKRGTVLKSPDMFYGVKTIIGSGKLDLESLKDLFEVRIMLEIGMADFIFMRRTENDLEELMRIIQEENATGETDFEKLARLDIQFHSTLYKISGNKTLRAFQHLLNTLFVTYSRNKDWKHKQIISHEALAGILAHGTPDAFRSAMRLHLNTRFEDMEKLFSGPEKLRMPDGVSQ